jgi:hypothetical protein
MLKINAKELVLKAIERQKRYNSLTIQEKIIELFESMEFDIRMYNKHKKHKNHRGDKKSLNYNLWTLISRIESLKKIEEIKYE